MSFIARTTGLVFASAGAWTMCITVIIGEFTHEKFFKNVFYFVLLKQKNVF